MAQLFYHRTRHPGGGSNLTFGLFRCIFALSVTGEMENSKSSKSDEGSDDKDDDTTDRKKTPEFEDKIVSKLLRRIGEKSLIPLFSQQRITMEMLMDLNHADLREVGIDIFGQRHKILTEVARLKRGKYLLIYLRNILNKL